MPVAEYLRQTRNRQIQALVQDRTHYKMADALYQQIDELNSKQKNKEIFDLLQVHR